MKSPAAHILESWNQNADAWTVAVRDRQIESRRLVTDRAIVEAILQRQPGSVWDIGCGEGWLCRALGQQGVICYGTDAIAALIEAAQNAGGADYEVLGYEDITSGKLPVRRFDLAVCNFSLFGDDAALGDMLSQVRMALQSRGRLLIQTLHPHTACGELPYQSGWRQGSWQGFSEAFVNPAPWYFRTVQDWITLLTRSGYSIEALEEPLHPHTGRPASLILEAVPK